MHTTDGDARSAFAARLTIAMERAGHTRATLGRAIEVHPNRIGDWMAGRRWPHVRHAVLTALELRVTTDWLLGSTDGPAPAPSTERADRLARSVAEQLAAIAPQLGRLARDAKRMVPASDR